MLSNGGLAYMCHRYEAPSEDRTHFSIVTDLLRHIYQPLHQVERNDLLSTVNLK